MFVSERPDVFIGIDAPDTNLRIAKRLREAGIPTVQYVSPQIWAWRQGRVRTIGAAVDLVLEEVRRHRDGTGAPRQLLHPHTLIVRESTGAAPPAGLGG